MNAPPQAVPRPPAPIWDELVAAGAANDPVRLGLAHAAYVRWLEEQGYRTGLHGSEAPKEAFE